MGRTGRLSTLACCIATILLTLGAATAPGHQTESSKGVSVTMHVTPEDEPIAGRSSKILVTKVKPNRGRFSWRSCKCYLRISDTTGKVVLNRKAKSHDELHVPEGKRLRARVLGSCEARWEVQALPRRLRHPGELVKAGTEEEM